MATTGDHPLVLSTALRSSSVDAAVAIWPSGQKSCSLLNQLRCCLLANWAKRISLECVFYASATDRGLALTSKALVLSCDASFMVQHSGYDSVAQIQNTL